MIKNYLTIALRNILKSKVHSSINILGLALAITCCILIILFIKDEYTYDRFHTNADRIYRPWAKATRPGGEEMTNVVTPFPLGRQLTENFSEVEDYTLYVPSNTMIRKGELMFSERIYIGSEGMFRMFDFQVLNGLLDGSFSTPDEIVITGELAEKYFGRTDVAGEFLSLQMGGEFKEYEIQAVIASMPSNSSISFDVLIPDHNLKFIFPERMLDTWFMIAGENYVMLTEGASAEELDSKLPTLVNQVLGEENVRERPYELHLQALTDIHLNTELPQGVVPVSNPRYTLILAGIALLVLIVASINFMTLSIGKSFTRAREIGVRKSVGAGRGQLVSQFLGEAVMLSMVALVLGVVLTFITLPLFNELASRELVFNLDLSNILLFLGLSIVVGLMAGIYPALVLSGFKPASVLKGQVSGRIGKNRLRMVLVTLQFVLSIFLITSTLVMKRQLFFMQNTNLGFDQEQVVVVPLNITEGRGIRDRIIKGFEMSGTIEPEVEGLPPVMEVAVTSHTFEPGQWTEIGYNDMDGEEKKFFFNTVSHDFVKALNMELVGGRDFSRDIPSDEKRSVIVNESFVNYYQLDDPVGDRIPNEGFDDHEIIGVVKDFHFESLHTKIQPLMLALTPNIGFSGAHSINIGSSADPKLVIKLAPNQIREGLSSVERVWSEFYPDEPFEYDFIEDNLKSQYEAEINLGKIVTSSSILALVIGCMGLFGLASLVMNSKVKEISIRKIFGASQQAILMILSRNFAVIVLISLIIAAPATIYVMNRWLDSFEYRIPVGFGIFLAAGIGTLVVALITVSYHSIKVARTNPAETLRNE